MEQKAFEIANPEINEMVEFPVIWPVNINIMSFRKLSF